MVTLRIKVVPNARQNRVVGRLGDAIKVHVSSPPERGKANQVLIEVLAGFLGVAASAVEIASGATQARKVVRVTGLDASDIDRRLSAL